MNECRERGKIGLEQRVDEITSSETQSAFEGLARKI